MSPGPEPGSKLTYDGPVGLLVPNSFSSVKVPSNPIKVMFLMPVAFCIWNMSLIASPPITCIRPWPTSNVTSAPPTVSLTLNSVSDNISLI